MSSTEMLRLFIALELPKSVLDLLEIEQGALRDLGAPVKWVAPQGIHLTLQFLGSVEARRTDALLDALEKAAGGLDPFSLHLEGLGAFPGLRRPRVVWIGLGGDLDMLQRAHTRVVRATERIGFKPEARPFKPHLTLGRVREDGDRSRIEALGAAIAGRTLTGQGAWTAETVSLIRSELLPGGARYTLLGARGFAWRGEG